MLDDEIVCLGSSLATDLGFQRQILGVILHVEKSAESPEYSILFKRANINVILIGRRSGSEPDRRYDEHPTSAMFRCAVVSRKHAKIVFSDSGHAYIVDSSSHHGTHVRRTGEAVSKRLKPETSNLLHDGDVITFGKAVGKGDEWVTPIVVRVELYRGTSSSKPSSLPSPSSEKSKAGRYGIDDDGLSSCDQSSAESDSDIEEIPAPSPKPISHSKSQIIDLENDNNALVQNHVSTAYNAFKRLLSPAIRKLPSVSEIIGDRNNGGRPISDEDDRLLRLAPVAHNPSAEVSIDLNTSLPNLFDVPHGSSPIAMDLGTPVSCADFILSRPLSVPYSQGRRESSVPILEYHEPSPISPSYSPTTPLSPMSPHLPIPPDASLPQTSSAPLNEVLTLPPLDEPMSDHGESQDQPSSSHEVTEMRQSLQSLQASVNKLRFSRRKYKTRFNTNVSFISRKLSEIDDKFAEVDAEYNVLCDQVETMSHEEIPDLALQLEQLEDRVKTLEWAKTCDDAGVKIARREPSQPFDEQDQVEVNLKKLEELLPEIRKLKEQVGTDLTTRYAELEVARTQAIQDIERAKTEVLAMSVAAQLPSTISTSAVNQSIQVRPPSSIGSQPLLDMPVNLDLHPQTPVLPSLKRKRDDTDENEDQGLADECVDIALGDIEGAMAVDQAVEPTFQHEAPPRKRARRILSVIGQTATAVTIGAVVTWTTLAFS